MNFNRQFLASFTLILPRNFAIAFGLLIGASFIEKNQRNSLFLIEIITMSLLFFNGLLIVLCMSGDIVNETRKTMTYIEFNGRQIQQSDTSPPQSDLTNSSPDSKLGIKVTPLSIQKMQTDLNNVSQENIRKNDISPRNKTEINQPSQASALFKSYGYEKLVLILASILDGFFCDLWPLFITLNFNEGGLNVELENIGYMGFGIYLGLLVLFLIVLNRCTDSLFFSGNSKLALLAMTVFYLFMPNVGTLTGNSRFGIIIFFTFLLFAERYCMFFVSYYAVNIFPKEHIFITKIRYLIKTIAAILSTLIFSVDASLLNGKLQGRILSIVQAAICLSMVLSIVWNEYSDNLDLSIASPRATKK